MIVHKHIHKHSHRLKCKHTYGEGILDSIKPIVELVTDNKDLIKQVAEPITNIMQIGKNTKQIIDSIKNKDRLTIDERLAFQHKHLKNIVDRINNIKMGSGFAIV